jgi:hypothetical protein
MNDRSRFTIIQQGDGNSANQVNGPVDRLRDLAADREAMTKFVSAAAGSLAALDLSPGARHEAVRMLGALETEEGDDGSAHARRRELAASLWRIVEGAAGSALGSALLGIWQP